MRFVEVTLESWQQVGELAARATGFVYRGQADAAWSLSTSIERAYERYKPAPYLIEVGEKWTMHEFQQKYGLFSAQPPPSDSALEWLALLQHHGCPTRLLDFTFSVYVAAHFAAATAVSDAAIWAISHWGVRDSLKGKFDLQYKLGHALKDEVNAHHIRLFNDCMAASDRNSLRRHLIPVEPTRLSTRMARQQGLFLAPTTLRFLQGRSGFMDCLANSFKVFLDLPITFEHAALAEVLQAQWPAEEFACIKFILPAQVISQALKQLDQMGITDEVLFPDLDGLARSLVLKHIRQ